MLSTGDIGGGRRISCSPRCEAAPDTAWMQVRFAPLVGAVLPRCVASSRRRSTPCLSLRWMGFALLSGSRDARARCVQRHRLSATGVGARASTIPVACSGCLRDDGGKTSPTLPCGREGTAGTAHRRNVMCVCPESDIHRCSRRPRLAAAPPASSARGFYYRAGPLAFVKIGRVMSHTSERNV